MERRYVNFQEKRKEIFRELVKQGWKEGYFHLDDIVEKFKKEYGFTQEDVPFLKNHIRVAMGLDTEDEGDFFHDINNIINFEEIEEPIVTKINGVCEHCEDDYEKADCFEVCKYEAQRYRKNKGPKINEENCVSCGKCVTKCSFGAIADKIEFIPLIDMLKDDKTKVFAAVAPSIAGQFGKDISLGQLRTAFKMMGFYDMVEVALFADILTIKEAYEFDNLVKTEEDFYLTSCCCPVWINMVMKQAPEMLKHMSLAVSPMIASGRILKDFYPEAKVVFIGPCVAKKAEAKANGLKGAIDFVLTYSEMDDIFKALDINLEELPREDKDHASFGGRVYARTGGVSLSVKSVVNRIAPNRLIKFKSKKVDGVKDCKNLLEKLKQESVDYNFIEGMGCEGGCVGGPRTNIDVEDARNIVNSVAEDSVIMTPFDNLNVVKTLKNLGLSKVEEITKENKVHDLISRRIKK